MPAVLLECKLCGCDVVEGDEKQCEECKLAPLCDDCLADHDCEI